MTLAIDWVGSPNKRKGRAGFRPEAIVIHVMDGTLVGTDAWFLNPRSRVSAHYGIGSDGSIHQYVLDSDTAFHAGRKQRPTWRLIRKSNPNLYTLGIEHEGNSTSQWSEDMRTSSAALIAELARRWAIRIDRDHVIGHREIFAGKTCPGTGMDLGELVDMARREALSPQNYNFIENHRSVRVRVDVNVRREAPTTEAEVAAVLRAGELVEVDGWTSDGQNVSGNAHWYRLRGGGHFWAGASMEQLPRP